MQINEISFRRVYNLGNYETVTLELRAAINENDNVVECLDNLKKICDDYYHKKKEEQEEKQRKYERS